MNRIYKVEIEILHSDIEGKECISSRIEERYFESFEEAVWYAEHPDIETDFWTQTRTKIIEYEISSIRELKRKATPIEYKWG